MQTGMFSLLHLAQGINQGSQQSAFRYYCTQAQQPPYAAEAYQHYPRRVALNEMVLVRLWISQDENYSKPLGIDAEEARYLPTRTTHASPRQSIPNTLWFRTSEQS